MHHGKPLENLLKGFGETVPTELICPACVGELEQRASYYCLRCKRTYPIVAGIADLRLWPDRYLTLHEDRRKAEKIASYEGSALDLVDAYWSMTPEVPTALARLYRGAAQRSIERGVAILDRLGPLPESATLLDVGCGTGGLVVAAAKRGADAVGIDVALRWLVVCARLAQDEGVAASFVAADGAVPPFRQHSFDAVTCVETLEHAADPQGTLQNALRLSKDRFLAVTFNRFSLAPDPTLRLMLPGLLPHRIRTRYVQARRGTGSANYAPLSLAQLQTWLGPAPIGRRAEVLVRAGRLPPVGSGGSWVRRFGTAVHDRVVAGPLEQMLRPIAPMLEISQLDRESTILTA